MLAQGATESGFPEWRMWGQIWKEGEKQNWREEKSESTRTQGSVVEGPVFDSRLRSEVKPIHWMKGRY